MNHSNKLKYSDQQRIDYMAKLEAGDSEIKAQHAADRYRDRLDLAMNAAGYLYGSDLPAVIVRDPTKTGPASRLSANASVPPIDSRIPWDSDRYLREKAIEDEAAAKAKAEREAAGLTKPGGH